MALFLAVALATPVWCQVKSSPTVYRIETSSSYHLADCPLGARAGRKVTPIALKQALKDRLDACHICHPEESPEIADALRNDPRAIKAAEKLKKTVARDQARAAKDNELLDRTAKQLGLAPADLRLLQAEPTSFMLPKDQANDAWGRAQAFVGQYASMKLQLASDYVVQTFTPTGSKALYGYQVTRSPGQNGDTFSISCTFSNMFTSGQADFNARIASHFIRTGRLLCSNCIAR